MRTRFLKAPLARSTRVSRPQAGPALGCQEKARIPGAHDGGNDMGSSIHSAFNYCWDPVPEIAIIVMIAGEQQHQG